MYFSTESVLNTLVQHISAVGVSHNQEVFVFLHTVKISEQSRYSTLRRLIVALTGFCDFVKFVEEHGKTAVVYSYVFT